MTKTSARRGPWRIVFWVALAIFGVSVAALGFIAYGYWAGQNTYNAIESLAFAGEDDKKALKVDWQALQEVNPEVCGWIYVPDTPINYPIVHRDGDDSFYLDHDFNGDTSGLGPTYGCVMLSGANKGNWSDTVNFVFGHNMSNGMMFAAFNDWRDEDVFNAHQMIYLLTPEGGWELRPFAIDRVAGTDSSIVVQNFRNPSALQAYVQARIDASLVAADTSALSANSIKKVFAFSTCDPDNSWRTIVFACPVRTLS